MLRFRPATESLGPVGDLFAIGQLIDDVIRPGHFFVAPELRVKWVAAQSETIRWEIFRGRVLDGTQTREERAFLSWHVIEENSSHPATESLISVKLDVHERRIHVTRGLLCYAQEGYDAGGGVIECRETLRWKRELVGTIDLADFNDLDDLRDELICLIWQAVVGTSRLPLTSIEAPLPAYLFGKLHYRYRADASDTPLESWRELLNHAFGPEVAWAEPHKIMEFVLRGVSKDELPQFVESLLNVKPHGWAVGEIGEYWARMFNDVSLSPYTEFVDNALMALDLLAERNAISAGERINFLERLLRKLGRHLTAYDLVTFHHRGANYPDALLLDALLERLLDTIEHNPDRFQGDDLKARLRRRALRQACLMRKYYEGHLVPDLPTSPGENARVLPASHPRVPEEQLLQVVRRRRQLYDHEPLTTLLTTTARRVLAHSIADLARIDERAELGMGVFIDRPLGYGKQVGEPDATPLLAHEAFSASIARRRWLAMKNLAAELGIPIEGSMDSLFEDGPWPVGLPNAEIADCPRPVTALADVRNVAGDFVILRTLPVGLFCLLRCCDWKPLVDLYQLQLHGQVRLCVQAMDPAGKSVLAFYDSELRRRLEMNIDWSAGFRTRAGIEWPRAGLRAIRVWEDNSAAATEIDFQIDAQRPV